MEQINEILRNHRFRQGDYFVRFQATRFPKPTISLVLYFRGKKVFERPIRRLGEFIEDLQDVYDILRTVRTSTVTTRRFQRRRDRQNERQSQPKRQQKRKEIVEEEVNTDEEEEEEESENDVKRS